MENIKEILRDMEEREKRSKMYLIGGNRLGSQESLWDQ